MVEPRRARRTAVEEDKKLVAKWMHPGPVTGRHRLATEEVRHVGDIELAVRELERAQHCRDIRLVHEPERDLHVNDTAREVDSMRTFSDADIRLVGYLDRYEHHLFVQNSVMPDGCRERRRDLAVIAEHIDRSAGHPPQSVVFNISNDIGQSSIRLLQATADQFASAAPGRHLHDQYDSDEQRKPATRWNLWNVRREKRNINDHERDEHNEGLGARPTPSISHKPEENQCRNQHGRRDRDAIRRCQRTRRLENQDQRDTADHQQPVHQRHVDLADVIGRRVTDRQTREIVELNSLSRQRERSGD